MDLQSICETYRDQFVQKKNILSFEEYLSQLHQNLYLHTRSAYQYLHDCFLYFGYDKTLDLAGKERYRFHQFSYADELQVPIQGCEAIHDEIFRVLERFVKQGRANKLILLHGPNGSAKTSTIDAIATALGRYSASEEGVVYTFNWIFPQDKEANPSEEKDGRIGFAATTEDRRKAASYESFAHLAENKIACKLSSELKDAPFTLIPKDLRSKVFSTPPTVDGKEISPLVWQMGPSKKNQQIFESLLAAYQGDLALVLRHVQVERFYFSKPYRVGVATVEPQMAVDASERQLTMEKHLSQLPSFLGNIRFYEIAGPLVEANRGILEFSDMLKRPIEAFKYLLNTIEKSSINLASASMALDTVFFATTNDKHLDAFRAYPDFQSFRSRFELIPVPYLLDFTEEEKIYTRDIEAIRRHKPVAPHALRALSQWAVMSRLHAPRLEEYPKEVRGLLQKLTPMTKSCLYANTDLGPSFSQKEKETIQKLREKIAAEHRGVLDFEGKFGPSPREVRNLLHKASQNPLKKTLTPVAIFDELEVLVRDSTQLDFFKMPAHDTFVDHAKILADLKADFKRRFERELMQCLDLVDPGRYEQLLHRYIQHVTAFLKGEKIYSDVTKTYEAPSEDLMKEVEKHFHKADAATFRQSLMNRVASYKLEHKSEKLDIKHVFSDLLEALSDQYHEGQRKKLDDALKLIMLDSERAEGKSAKSNVLKRLEERFGYDPESAEDCLRFYKAQA